MKRLEYSTYCPAWELYGDAPTNYRLKDGDKVVTRCECNAEGYYLLPAGTEGIVVDARTPKVSMIKGSSPYFANVECTINDIKYRIRVPHKALKRMKQ